MLNKFWNNRLGGALGGMILVLKRLLEELNDKATTFFVTRNLGLCGKNVIIRRGFQYRLPNNISIGENVEIGRNVIFSSELDEGRMIIEDNVIIGRNSKIDFSGNLIIKKGTLLSEGVNVQTHDHGLNPKSTPVGKELIIEEDCWIGLNAMILSNVNIISRGTVIGANSLLTKSILDGGVYGGAPARKIK